MVGAREGGGWGQVSRLASHLRHALLQFGRSEVLAWLVEKKHNSLVAQTSAGLTPCLLPLCLPWTDTRPRLTRVLALPPHSALCGHERACGGHGLPGDSHAEELAGCARQRRRHAALPRGRGQRGQHCRDAAGRQCRRQRCLWRPPARPHCCWWCLSYSQTPTLVSDPPPPTSIQARVDSFETVELLINRDPRLFFALTDDGNSPMLGLRDSHQLFFGNVLNPPISVPTRRHLAAMHGAESTLRWLLEERKRRPTSEVAAAWIDRFVGFPQP